MSVYICRSIEFIVRMFVNYPGPRDSIPGRVIPKTHTIVLYDSLLNTPYFKIWITVRGEIRGKEKNPLLDLSVLEVET